MPIFELSPLNSHASAVPVHTPSPFLLERNPRPLLITLTISQPLTTYATVILLGDTFPTPSPTPTPTSPPLSLPPTTTSTPAPAARVQTPGVPTGTVLGIVIGCALGFLALIALFYVYLVRARRRERRRWRRWRERQAAKEGAAGEEAAPAAEEAPAEGAPAAEGEGG
ncbi:hypothetical protein B7494_g2572 [Chlorociboria aeruginascens]|nr:hypothetical protein B7494_g2572 [Chlorociboria aeruginascens]